MKQVLYTPAFSESTKHTVKSRSELGLSESHSVFNHKTDLPWYAQKREQERYKLFRWIKEFIEACGSQTPFEEAASTSAIPFCLQR